MDAQQTTFWAAYEPSDAAPWNLARVVHLHRRAGFAAPWNRLQTDLAEGPEPSIERLLRGQEDGPAGFDAMARTIGDAATASGNAARLKAWWIYRMLLSPDPLGERLTLMWHSHFATSNRKVQDLITMRGQNDLLREHARAPFGELLSAVVKHPAMLVWLDADSNRKGHPNENLAREMMELFTLGIGNYTESDVKEGARALTGWTIVDSRFGVVDGRHDAEEKVVLEQRGKLTGDDFIKLLVDHPATSRRLAWRICQTFLGENGANEEAVAELADGLATRRLDVGWAVATVIRSQRFFSAENMHSRVVGPLEYIVGALRALELCDPPPSTLLLAEWSTRIGQDLFYPPNVGGWSEGRAWLSSRAIVARANFAAALVEGRLWHPQRLPDLESIYARHGTSAEPREKISWYAELLWGERSEAAVQDTVQAAEAAMSARPLALAVALLLARPEHQLT